MNYEQAMEYIHAVQWAGHKPGLTRTRTLLAALGDPHKQLRFVHVAAQAYFPNRCFREALRFLRSPTPLLCGQATAHIST